ARRRGPPGLLAHDARVRRAREDDPLRDALPGGGGRLRGPRGADGAGPGRRGRPDERAEGDGWLAHDPRDASWRGALRAAGAHRCERRGPPWRGDSAHVRGLRRGDPRAAGSVPAGARHRDQRRGPGAGVPGADGRAGRGRSRTGARAKGLDGVIESPPLVYLRYELLRTFRNRRFFVLSLVFPLVLYLLIAGS